MKRNLTDVSGRKTECPTQMESLILLIHHFFFLLPAQLAKGLPPKHTFVSILAHLCKNKHDEQVEMKNDRFPYDCLHEPSRANNNY